jgi:hypothetical protein
MTTMSGVLLSFEWAVGVAPSKSISPYPAILVTLSAWPSTSAVVRLRRAEPRSSVSCPCGVLSRGTPENVEEMSEVSLRDRKIPAGGRHRRAARSVP